MLIRLPLIANNICNFNNCRTYGYSRFVSSFGKTLLEDKLNKLVELLNVHNYSLMIGYIL